MKEPWDLTTMVAAERQAMPDPQRVEHGWERLSKVLSAGPDLAPPLARSPRKPSTTTRLAKVAGAVLVGGTALWGARAWILLPNATEPSARSQSPAASDTAEPYASPPSPTGTSLPLPASPESPAALEVGKRPTAPSTFDAELALIKHAKAELDAEHATAVLALVSEHSRRVPHGVFAGEREALRILALCLSGRSVEGRNLASQFAQVHPRSPLVDRVWRACRLGASRDGGEGGSNSRTPTTAPK